MPPDWILICDECVAGREVKTIGIMRRALQCENCGKPFLTGERQNPWLRGYGGELRFVSPSDPHVMCECRKHYYRTDIRAWVRLGAGVGAVVLEGALPRCTADRGPNWPHDELTGRDGT